MLPTSNQMLEELLWHLFYERFRCFVVHLRKLGVKHSSDRQMIREWEWVNNRRMQSEHD